MAYTYVAIDTRDEVIKAAFPRKHELTRWAKRYDVEAPESDPYRTYHLAFFRVRSVPWESDSIVTEISREELGLVL